MSQRLKENNYQLANAERCFSILNFQLLEDLFAAYFDARRNKRNTINQLRFELDFERNLLELYEQLLDRSYTISPSIAFIVTNPVQREIFAADFRDRILHHLLYNYMGPVIERQLIDDCYSCRKMKGTHYGVQRMTQFLKDCSENYTRDCYILKLDIRGYFMSIDKPILWEKLERLLRPMTEADCSDMDLMWWLLDKVIWHDPTQSCIIKCDRSNWIGLPPSKSLFHTGKNCGLPIGNLTSQLFSNVYLHEFDSFVKNDLGFEYYGRYVDDFVLVHPDKKVLLQAKEKIDSYLKETCRLELHPNKIYLQHYRKGVAFIGAYIKPHRNYVSNRTKKKFINLMYKTHESLSKRPPTQATLSSLRSSVNSYLGIMRHYKTYNIRKKVLLSKTRPHALLKYGYLCVKRRGMVFRL